MTYKVLSILLFLYVSFPALGQAQKIHLDIKTSNQRIDSIASIYFPERVFENQNKLLESLNKSKESLFNNGYFKHRFINLKPIQDSIYSIQFFSGRKTEIIKLKFKSDLVRSNAKILKIETDSSHIYIRPNKLKEILERFVELDAKNGRPLSNYSISNFEVLQDTAQAKLSIHNTSSRHLSEILIKGYEKFPRSFLKYSANLKEDQLFNEEVLNRSLSKLSQIPFITTTKEPEILFKNDSTSIYLYIEKKNANQFEGFLGFASKEDNTGLRLNGNLNLKLTNTLNFGENIDIHFQGNGDNQQQLETSIRMPYILKSAISFTPSLRLFRQDSSFSISETNLKFDYTKSPNLLLNTSVNFISSNQLQTEETPINIANFKKTAISTGLEYKNNSYSLTPNPSNYLNLSIGFASRKTADPKSKVNQFLIDSENSYTINLFDKHSIYLKNSTSYISPKSLLLNELSQFGGMQTIRGYKENSIYASFFSTLQSEYQYKPVNSIIINTVFDVAYYENPVSENSNLIYGIGIGGSAFTKAGWLSMNVVSPFNKIDKTKLSNSVIHIAIKSNF